MAVPIRAAVCRMQFAPETELVNACSRIELCKKIANFHRQKAKYVGRATGNSVAHSAIVFFVGRLAMPLTRYDVQGAPLFFERKGW